jgi:hypothetical protein
MSANISGRRLKVLAGGLHQLSSRCESLAGALSAIAAPSLGGFSTWQANAGVVNVACVGSLKDLAGLAARMDASATKYAKAGVDYTQNDEDSAAELRGLAP